MLRRFLNKKSAFRLRKSFSKNYELLTIESQNEGKLQIMNLNNPRKRNALSKQMLSEMNDALDSISTDNTIQTLILRSSTAGMFCAGADLKERIGYTNEQTEETVKGLRATFQRFTGDVKVPVIACMDGACLGGGLELAMACDLRVATTSSKIGLPETGLAIIPGAGGTARLPRLVGPAIAKELIFTGAILEPERALNLGIVNYVEEDYNAAFERCLALAKIMSQKGPLAIRAAKYALNFTLDRSLEDALKLEEEAYGRIVDTEDRIEGLTAFMEKRRPEYKGK